MPKYSIKYKKKVLAHFKIHGIAKTISCFGVHKSVIYDWDRKSETVGLARKVNSKYSKEDKLEIQENNFKNGTTETDRLFNVRPSVILKWERIYREYGLAGLDHDGKGRKPKSLGAKKIVNNNCDLLEENRMLRMENEYLKKLDALVQEREERERKKK